MTFRILLTGGGSGGPTTPLLAVYEALAAKIGEHEVACLFYGTANGPERGMVEKIGIPFQTIPSGKLRRYWSWQNLLDPLLIIGAFFISLKRLWHVRPQVIVSAGSFVSVPVAYAAWCLRIPHVIFQMDVKPGLANRLMAPVSHTLLYLFEQTARQLPVKQKIKIGPVIRADIANASAHKANERFHLNQDKPVLLITGGGQGALKINEAVAQSLPFLLKAFQVVHLTGPSHAGATCNDPDYHAIPFVHEGMGDLLARSDLVVTRAGLGIIGECAHLAKDIILIPIPGTHQELNASLLVAQQAAVILPQQEFLDNAHSWWTQFLETYQPGKTGQRLQQLLPQGGASAFADHLLSYSLTLSQDKHS